MVWCVWNVSERDRGWCGGGGTLGVGWGFRGVYESMGVGALLGGVVCGYGGGSERGT